MEPKRIGRPLEFDAHKVAQMAMKMFVDQGFDQVTMDDGARKVGVNRRTLFRYFPSKNTLVWGELEEAVRRLMHQLEEVEPDADPLIAARKAYVLSLTFAENDLAITRERLVLIAAHPGLYAHGIHGQEEVRQVVATFLADRWQQDVDSLRVTLQSRAIVDTGYAALIWWARYSDDSPSGVVAEAFDLMSKI